MHQPSSWCMELQCSGSQTVAKNEASKSCSNLYEQAAPLQTPATSTSPLHNTPASSPPLSPLCTASARRRRQSWQNSRWQHTLHQGLPQSPPPRDDKVTVIVRTLQHLRPRFDSTSRSLPGSRLRGLAVAGCAHSYKNVVRLRCVQLKVLGREPEDLAPGFDRALRTLAGACGCHLSEFYVRKGCIELTLDLEAEEEEEGDPDGEDGAGGSRGGCMQLHDSSSSNAGDRASSGSSARQRPDSSTSSGLRRGMGLLSSQEGMQAMVAEVVKLAAGLDASAVDVSILPVACTAEVTGSEVEAAPPKYPFQREPRFESLLPPDGLARSRIARSGGLSRMLLAGSPSSFSSLSGPVHSPWAKVAARARDSGHAPSAPLPVLARGPVISRVHPRVVVVQIAEPEVAAAAQRLSLPHHHSVDQPDTASSGGSGSADHGLLADGLVNSMGPGEGSASCFSDSNSTSTVNDSTPTGSAPSSQDDAVSSAPSAEPALLFETTHQRPKPVTAVTPLVFEVEITSYGGVALPIATAGSCTSTAPVADCDRCARHPTPLRSNPPPLELLVRCNGRYLPIATRITATSKSPASPPRPRVAPTDVASVGIERSAGTAAAPAALPAATASNTPVRYTYEVTLLGPPPANAALLLLDLRWRSCPVQVVPVLLLQPQPQPQQGEQGLAAELAAVASTWGGPPQELDGFLYDTGAWMKGTAARRGGGRCLHGAAAGSGGMGSTQGPEPAYLPVLGASLLQFAHANRLKALAARLQDDMRGAGYTASFGSLLNASPLPVSVLLEPQQPGQPGDSTTGAGTCDSASAAATGAPAGPPQTSDTPQPIAPTPKPLCSWDPSGWMLDSAFDSAYGEAGLLDSNAACTPSHIGACAAAFGSPLSTASSLTRGDGGAHAEKHRDAITEACALLRSVAETRCVALEDGPPPGNAGNMRGSELCGEAGSSHLRQLNLLGLLEVFFLALLATPGSNGIDGSSGSGVALLGLPAAPAAALAVALLPVAVAFGAWLVLPPRLWQQAAESVWPKLARLACSAVAKLMLLSAAVHSYQVDGLSLVILALEGAVMPAACFFAPAAALLVASLKFPIFLALTVAAGATSAVTAGAAPVLGSSDDATFGLLRVLDGGNAALAVAMLRALPVAVAGVLCHVLLRMRLQSSGSLHTACPLFGKQREERQELGGRLGN